MNDILGKILPISMTRAQLEKRVAKLCGLATFRFPGAQPVSFSRRSLRMLETSDFWVCQKSDGLRLVIFITMNRATGKQDVWLIDRKGRFFLSEGLHFPHWTQNSVLLTETILDGELVVDKDHLTGRETLRFYAFDCLALHGDSLCTETFKYRSLKLALVVKAHRHGRSLVPKPAAFDVAVKQHQPAHRLKQLIHGDIPQLQQASDGLVFTAVHARHKAGTNHQILKWKPPSDITVDFRISLRFPPDADDTSVPDYFAMPVFILHTWVGNDKYEFFDEMAVEEDLWGKLKASQENLDGRIIEVSWDAALNTWRMLRIRDDKAHANHKSIVMNIISCIQDGVEIETLLSNCDSIRKAWFQRERSRMPGARPLVSTAAVRTQSLRPYHCQHGLGKGSVTHLGMASRQMTDRSMNDLQGAVGEMVTAKDCLLSHTAVAR